MEKYSINNRIEQLINKLAKNQSQFAKSINISSARMSNIKKHRNKPDSDLLYSLLEKYKKVNARWLITGQGDMFKNHNEIVTDSFEITTYNKKLDTLRKDVEYYKHLCSFLEQKVKEKL